MKTVTFKKPTKVGIARTLNDAGFQKKSYKGGTMVRGYGSSYSGWVCTELENGNFKIEYIVAQGTYKGVYNLGLTDEERIAMHERCTKNFINQLEQYTKALIAKGYNAYGFTKMVDGKMPSDNCGKRTYNPCKDVEGFVTVTLLEPK